MRAQEEAETAPLVRRETPEKSMLPTLEIVPHLGRPLTIAVATVSLLLGIALSLVVRFGVRSAPAVHESFLGVDPAPSDLVVRFEGTRAPPPPEVELAESMLELGRSHLAQRRIDDAERLFGLCIRLADLAECHRALAGTLALTKRPGARAHLELYLERAADAPDRSELSLVLEGRSKE